MLCAGPWSGPQQDVPQDAHQSQATRFPTSLWTDGEHKPAATSVALMTAHCTADSKCFSPGTVSFPAGILICLCNAVDQGNGTARK